jgi:hypothetical protein
MSIELWEGKALTLSKKYIMPTGSPPGCKSLELCAARRIPSDILRKDPTVT